MTQMADAIAELRKDIEQESAAIARERTALDEREKVLAGKEQALLVLERIGLGRPASHEAQALRASTSSADALKESNSLIHLNDLFTDVENRRRTLTDDVRDVVRRFGTQEFTVAHVEAAMKRLGIEVVGKTPRSRIALAVTKLCEEEILVRSFVGGGNVPHRYRLQASVTDEDLVRYREMNSVEGSGQKAQATDEAVDDPFSDTYGTTDNKKGGATT